MILDYYYYDEQFEEDAGECRNMFVEDIKGQSADKFTYLMTDGNLFKIGSSKNPEKRLKQLKTANPSITMVCYGFGIGERALHGKFGHLRVAGEWFDFDNRTLERVKHWIGNEDDRYVMPDGEYKGRRLYELPKGYMKKYIKRRLADPEAKREILAYLESL